MRVAPADAGAAAEALDWMQAFSAQPEPDWVLLSSGQGSEPAVLGGEVVFPSSWSLPEKAGLPLSAVHGPVPGLQAAIGAGIGTFLARLAAGACWQRENWGLSADAELNHHPALNRPRLQPGAGLEQTWLRLEHQFLTRLPRTGALLFGIRVTLHRLDHVAAQPAVAPRLARALRTLPAPMAEYKGLSAARPALLQALEQLPG
jgi:dimethylamine monooxygenase subunit A